MNHTTIINIITITIKIMLQLARDLMKTFLFITHGVKKKKKTF